MNPKICVISRRDRGCRKQSLRFDFRCSNIQELSRAKGLSENIKESLVDFEGTERTYRTPDACFKSDRDGTRQTFKK